MSNVCNYFMREWLRSPCLILVLSMGGCSYEGLGTIDQHYQALGSLPPRYNTISVCSAYGCRVQTKFKFTPSDIKTLQKLMSGSGKTTTPDEERRALGPAIAWMEKRVGDEVGTSADRPGDDLAGVGDPTQMDCVDVATNLTSYLLILQGNKFLKHHEVGRIFVKEDIRKGFDGWTHYAAIISDTRSQQRYAVDGWKLTSGSVPEITEVEKWYIDDKGIAFRQ